MQKRLNKGIAHVLSVLMLVSTLFTGLSAFGIAEPVNAASGDSHQSIVANLDANYSGDKDGTAIAKVFVDGATSESSANAPNSHIYYGDYSATVDTENHKFKGTNYYRVLNEKYGTDENKSLFVLSEYTWSGRTERNAETLTDANPQFNAETAKNENPNAAGKAQAKNGSDYQGSMAQDWCYRFGTWMFSASEQAAMVNEQKNETNPAVVFPRISYTATAADGSKWKTNTVVPLGGVRDEDTANPTDANTLKQDNLAPTENGKTINDKVFFLSASELRDYFMSDSSKVWSENWLDEYTQANAEKKKYAEKRIIPASAGNNT